MDATDKYKKPVIICIDDEQPILNTLNHQLRKRFGMTYRYEFAESAEEGMEIIEELAEAGEEVVMVITDQIMPGLTGDEFLVDLHEKHPKPIKVLLTGQAAISSAINAINNANLFRYLTKPWEEEDLLLTIDKGLQQYYLYDKLEEKNRELSETMEVFRRFVPDQIQERIAKEGISKIDLGGAEEGEASVLFSDLRSFSTLAESLTPANTLAFLNGIIAPMVPVIHDHRGFINQFVGDAIMSIFYEQSGDDATDAVQAAIAMQRCLSKINEESKPQGHPPVRMGIGIHSGKIITGTIGNQNRMDAVVMGDTVNLASRLENLTKYYGLNIIVSQDTVRRLPDARAYMLRPVDLVRVQGKQNPVEIFEVCDGADEESCALKSGMMNEYIAGLEAFRDRKWEDSRKSFQHCHETAGDDKVVQLYLERCDAMIAQPPQAEWDGVFNMSKSP